MTGHLGDKRSLITALSIGQATLPTLDTGSRVGRGGQVDAETIAGVDRPCYRWSRHGRWCCCCCCSLVGDGLGANSAGGRHDRDRRSRSTVGGPAEPCVDPQTPARRGSSKRPAGVARSSARGIARCAGRCRGSYRPAGGRPDVATRSIRGLVHVSAGRRAAWRSSDDARYDRRERWVRENTAEDAWQYWRKRRGPIIGRRKWRRR
jgi:hypothetical protein